MTSTLRNFLLGALLFSATVLISVVLQTPQALAVAGDGATSNIQLWDSNSNGEVDQITFEIANPNNETWSLSGTAPYGLSVTDGGSDVTISSVVRSSMTAFSNPITIQVNLNELDTDLSVDTSVSAVELIYTQVTGDQTCTNCIRDAIDEELNAIATGDGAGAVNTENDSAVPVMLTSSTGDTNNNGTIDRVTIAFSEAVDFTDAGGAADGFGALTLSNSCVIPNFDASVYNGGTTIQISSLTGCTANNTALTVSATYATGDATEIRESAAGALEVANGDVATGVDTATPQIVDASYQDNDADGQVDRVVLTFSEALDITSTFANTNLAVNTAGDFTSLAFGSSTTDLITTDGATTVTVNATVESSVVDTNSSTFLVETQVGAGAYSLIDNIASPNTNISATILAGDMTDGARPVLVSASPASGGSLVPATVDFTLTFSEDLTTSAESTSNIVVTASTGPSTYTLSESAGVVTVNPTGASFSSGATVTVTVGVGVVDSAGNTYNTDGTLAVDPYSFTAVTSSSGGGGNGSPSSTVTVTSDSVTVLSPNGGETLTGGSTSMLTWSSTGNINNINLSYSVDGGVTFSSIASGTANDGSYGWTVPNLSASPVLLRVVGRDSGGATLATDLSDLSFILMLNTALPTATPTNVPTVSMRTPSGALVEMTAGTLFRGVALSDVYRVNEDGTRHVFPNETTFFSWGYRFEDVVIVNDNQLYQLFLSARVTIKPGSSLVKIQTNPKVYQISDGAILHHVPSEATAASLFGTNWSSMVRDVPDVFFGDYIIGTPLAL